ncbi:unnamed protein product [Urochloa humidicola]
MANFAMDPRPHVPRGFQVILHDPSEPPRRLHSYIGAYSEKYNEDLAIAFFTPAVSKKDFVPMAAALKDFFTFNMSVRLAEVQPSPIGDAFVRFHSPVERERFLGKVIQFSPDYQLHLIKHDEGTNVRERDLDREAWLMVMMFPSDARSNNAISKALAGFGLLRYWFDTDINAIIVVKVHLHDEAEIPHDIVVSEGLAPKIRSWTCPVFVLKRQGIPALGDEDFFPPEGPVHPLSMDPPRWMGFNQGQQMGAGSEVADGPEDNMLGRNDGVEHPRDAVSAEGGGNIDQAAVVPMDAPRQFPSAVAPDIPPGFVKMVKVTLSNLLFSIPQSLFTGPFKKLRFLDLDLDGTFIPPYIADDSILLYLASVIFDQNDAGACVGFGPPRPPVGLPLVPYSDSEDSDVEEIEPSAFKARSGKKRARKMKEPLGKPFVRRSKRLNPDHEGYRTEELKEAAVGYPDIYAGPASNAAEVAPYLSLENIQGIATQYLKIQPEAVSADVLLELDRDDDA